MKKSRIDLIDILRGFALLLIVLIHFAEHFEFHKEVLYPYFFSKENDTDTMFWALQFIRGNAYSIFALLFGLSFYIQMNNKAEKGIDYRKGFAWRMIVLLFIGFLNSLVYRGDILHMYALFALPVLLIYPLRTKALSFIAIVLLLQLPLVYKIISTYVFNPEYKHVKLYPYWKEGNEISAFGSFWEVIKFNFYKGRHASWVWTIDVGRYLQIWGLFILGIILGRTQLFHDSKKYQKVFIWTFVIALPLTLFLAYTSEITIKGLEIPWHKKKDLRTFIDSIKNIFGTASYISAITLLFHAFPKAYIFTLFKNYGKLSLTNYIIQGTFGVLLYYGFGFQLWKYLGATWSILLGATFFFIQAYISVLWNKHFYYGPFEWLWRCLTDRSFKILINKNKALQMTST